MNESMARCYGSALQDCVMLSELFDVDEKVVFVNIIKGMNPIQLMEMSNVVVDLQTDEEHEILKECLVDVRNPVTPEKEWNDDRNKLIQDNFDQVIERVATISNSSWLSSRDSFLSEAESDDDDIRKLVKYTSAAGIITKFIHDPKSIDKTFIGLKNYNIEKFNKVKRLWHYLNSPSGRNYLKQYKELREKGASKETTREFIEKAYKSRLKTTARKAGKAIKKGTKVTAKYGAIAGGVVAFTTALYATYNRFFSNAAKQCNKVKGTTKTKCMLHARIRACDAAVTKARQDKTKCSRSSDPQKCKHRIDAEVWKWERRKRKYQTKLAKLAKK